MKSFSFPLFNSFGKIWWKEIQEECIEWDDRLWDAKNTNDLRRMGKNRKLFWGRTVQILRKISHSIWWEGNSGDFIFLSKESVSQFSPVTQLCPTLWDHMDCSTPGLPVYHQLLEFTQNHVHRVGDTIQPSHLLSSPSPPTFNLSLQSGSFPVSQLFTSGSQTIRTSVLASDLPMNIQGWFPLGSTGFILLSKGLSRVFSSTTT